MAAVIPTNEELMIAMDTAAIVTRGGCAPEGWGQGIVEQKSTVSGALRAVE
jgi:hypothetical protein